MTPPLARATQRLTRARKPLPSGSQAVLESNVTSVSHKPEQVAEKIMDLIRMGDERANPAPEQFGGAFKG